MERKKKIDVLIDLILPEFLIFLQKHEEKLVYTSDENKIKTNKNSKLVKIILPKNKYPQSSYISVSSSGKD